VLELLFVFTVPAAALLLLCWGLLLLAVLRPPAEASNKLGSPCCCDGLNLRQLVVVVQRRLWLAVCAHDLAMLAGVLGVLVLLGCAAAVVRLVPVCRRCLQVAAQCVQQFCEVSRRKAASRWFLVLWTAELVVVPMRHGAS
jgi:hypothetical protein